jgi:hypothetical protein
MAHVFISHSSNDQIIAESLAVDLRNRGYIVWLDSWRIKVGQCIVRAGTLEILDALAHYEATKLNASFYHAVDGVRAKLASISEVFMDLQHAQWDYFEAKVGSLTAFEQRSVQTSNTESYLTKWHLTIAQLKSQLKLLGVYDGDINDELTDDVFDAIIQFQRKHNLRHIDGVFGPLTDSEMEKVSRSIVNR